MIKIISVYSGPGGSTDQFIKLTNMFNAHGHETCFYGPSSFPENKCRFAQYKDKIDVEDDDIIISHLIAFTRHKGKSIYSCHEQHRAPITPELADPVDKIHYVSEHQARWHGVVKPYFIIPNIVDNLQKTKCKGKVAGVVGLITRNKNTHISIKKALMDGVESVKVFGEIEDKLYWDICVQPLIDGDNVEYMGYVEDKQFIYDSISDLYHYSPNETYSLVVSEAKVAGVNVHLPPNASYADCYREFDNEVIWEMWKKELDTNE